MPGRIITRKEMIRLYCLINQPLCQDSFLLKSFNQVLSLSLISQEERSTPKYLVACRIFLGELAFYRPSFSRHFDNVFFTDLLPPALEDRNGILMLEMLDDELLEPSYHEMLQHRWDMMMSDEDRAAVAPRVPLGWGLRTTFFNQLYSDYDINLVNENLLEIGQNRPF